MPDVANDVIKITTVTLATGETEHVLDDACRGLLGIHSVAANAACTLAFSEGGATVTLVEDVWQFTYPILDIGLRGRSIYLDGGGAETVDVYELVGQGPTAH